MPIIAPVQTAIRIAVARVPWMVRRANGVTVPAIRRKIIEWSSLLISIRARLVFQSTRW